MDNLIATITRGAVSMDDQQTMLNKRFVCCTDVIALADTNEDPLVLFTNPAGSGKNAYLDSRKFVCETASHSLIVKLYKGPTIGANGTALTINNTFVGSSIASVMKLYKVPTISANGTLLEALAENSYVEYGETGLYVLPPGQSLLITGEAGTASTNAVVTLKWYEA